MKLNILKYALAALPLVTFSACMDFDTPSDEFNKETDRSHSTEMPTTLKSRMS